MMQTQSSPILGLFEPPCPRPGCTETCNTEHNLRVHMLVCGKQHPSTTHG